MDPHCDVMQQLSSLVAASTIPPSPSWQGCSQSLHPQPVLIPGAAPTQVQDFVFGLVEPHQIHMGPILEHVQIPLGGISATQLGIICELTESTRDPTIYVI